ncbi:peptide N-acetyl-beta-D-glucosaminyl asparaginase amidase A-domain-containing protein [Suillus occidentalis]|nr:peptide N-acetyl-beta-D-glucosaminyl asparaginase amidase A-domain-containing protein [Suillus occidentalis]
MRAFAPPLVGVLLAALSSAQVLVDFQVAEPPPVPNSGQQCTMLILERTFGNSYGDPEIVEYTPPTDCGAVGSWAAVTLNFTVTSNGTQYDRLGILTFQNTEIWRTSTPEPTEDGIIWTYTKDLDNIVTSTDTGEYATTLYATFYASSGEHPTAGQANMIVPISTMKNNTGQRSLSPTSIFLNPFQLNVTLPQNTIEIYAELYASGNGAEEFWYYNTADEYLGYLPPGAAYGGGPFREVRLLVDGQVAGVAFPYAVIFTGGINPGVWRPITSYGAIDLPTYFLDLTPFAPVFSDGLPHNVTLDVASAETNHTLNQNWYVSGLLQVVTDPSGKRTTGSITTYDAQPYAITETTASIGGADVNVTVKAQRSLKIESTIVSGSGTTNKVVFQQSMDFENTQYYLNDANIQNVAQISSGSVSSTHNGVSVLTDNFNYPLYINVTTLINNATETLCKFRSLVPAPFILGSDISERQQTAGFLTIFGSGGTANGTSDNTFSYVDTKGNTYARDVNAAYNVITYDKQSGSLAPTSVPTYPSTSNAHSIPGVRLPGGQGSV